MRKILVDFDIKITRDEKTNHISAFTNPSYSYRNDGRQEEVERQVHNLLNKYKNSRDGLFSQRQLIKELNLLLNEFIHLGWIETGLEKKAFENPVSFLDDSFGVSIDLNKIAVMNNISLDEVKQKISDSFKNMKVTMYAPPKRPDFSNWMTNEWTEKESEPSEGKMMFKSVEQKYVHGIQYQTKPELMPAMMLYFTADERDRAYAEALETRKLRTFDPIRSPMWEEVTVCTLLKIELADEVHSWRVNTDEETI